MWEKKMGEGPSIRQMYTLVISDLLSPRWLGSVPALGLHRDGPKGPSHVWELQEPQSAMEMVISMCFMCVLHMTRCLRVCAQAALEQAGSFLSLICCVTA